MATRGWTIFFVLALIVLAAGCSTNNLSGQAAIKQEAVPFSPAGKSLASADIGKQFSQADTYPLALGKPVYSLAITGRTGSSPLLFRVP